MAGSIAQLITGTGRLIGRVMIAGLSLALALFILFDLTLAAGVVWLNSPPGQDWARPKLSAALEESGYTLSYRNLVYSIADGLTLTGFQLGDAKGEIAQIDYASLRFNILSLAARRIALGFYAHDVILYRLPDGEEKERAESTPAFNPEEFFLKTIVLDRFAIDQLDIREAVFGQAMILSPQFSGRLGLKRDIDIRLHGRIDQNTILQIRWLPRWTMLDGTLNLEQRQGRLAKLTVNADAYHIEGKGDVAFGDDGENTLSLTMGSHDLSLLIDGEGGSASLSALLSGPAQDPVLGLGGHFVLDRLAERGLPEILLAANASALKTEPAGRLALSGTYQDVPLSFSTLFSYAKPVVNLTEMVLTGPDLTGEGAVTFNHSAMLANGQATITLRNLAAYAALAGQDIGGAADLALTLGASQGRQEAAIAATVTGGHYQDNRLGSGTIKATIGDLHNPWPQALDADLRHLSIGKKLDVDMLSAQLKEQENTYALTLESKGSFNRPFTLKGGALLGNVTGAVPSVSALDLTAQSGGSRATLTGGYSGEHADLTLSVEGFDPGLFLDDLPGPVKALRLTGKVTVKGDPAAPQIEASLSSGPVNLSENAPRVTLSADAHYRAGQGSIRVDGQGEGIRSLTGQAAIPLTFSLQPFLFDVSGDAALDGAFTADLKGGVLADMLLPPDHRFSGDLRGSGTLGGTIAQPDLQAALSLRNGSYDYTPYEIGLRDMVLDAQATRQRVTIATLTANDGGEGRLQASGVIGLAEKGDTKLNLSLDRFHVAKSAAANGYAGADLTLSAQPGGYSLGGAARLGQFDIVIPEQFRSRIPELNIVESTAGTDAPLQSIALDIELHAPNRIFVRGWGLDAEFGGDLDISGTLDAPQFNGEFESQRGRYEEFGRRFALARAKLRFQGTIPPSPYLDIEATTELDDITASVLLTGAVTKPAIKLSAIPALPEDEVMSHILFGKTMNRITPFQAIQLTQTLQRFSGHGGGGFDPLGQLRSLTGLDDIRVDTNEAGESSVGVGKYLTDKVYLEVEKGHGEASGAANLEIEITPSISLESKIGQDAQGGAGVFWSRDY